MTIKYNLSVPSDWEYAAKDYFLMGFNSAGASGVGEDIVNVVDILGADIPQGAARAWKTVVANTLSSLSLMMTSWEDVVARVDLLPGNRVTFELDLNLPSGKTQTLYRFELRSSALLGKERFTYPTGWAKVKRTDVNKENIPHQLELDDSCQSGILLIAADYYSPTYHRGLSEEDTSAFVGNSMSGATSVKRTLFCKETRENPSGQWTMVMDAPELSDEYKLHHTPLDLEEDEASIFFGHVGQESPVAIVTKVWKRIKAWFAGKSELNRYGV